MNNVRRPLFWVRARRVWFIALIILPLCRAGPSLYALEPKEFFGALEWAARGGLLFFPEGDKNASSPMPILPSPGLGVSYPFNSLIAAELSLDIYGNTYDYDYALGRAVPANDEMRSSFVTGIVTGFQGVFRFRPLGDFWIIRAYGGLALDFRLCLVAYGLKPDEVVSPGHTVGDSAAGVFSYFWGGGRWLLPVVGAGMDFKVLETVSVGFDLRVWFPLYRLWTHETLPAIEGFRFGAGLRLGFGKSER